MIIKKLESMNGFLHFGVRKRVFFLLILLCGTLGIFPVKGQVGLWTDDGNYAKDWPREVDTDGDVYNIRSEADLAAFAYLVNSG